MAPPSQASILLDLAQSAVIFRDADGETGYATIEVGTRQETWPLRSRGFRNWLATRFIASEGNVPGRQGLSDALDALEARARYEGAIEPVYVRVAPGPGATIIVDLVDEDWHAVHITPDGWAVTSASPAKFRRARGMQALPMPTHGGSLIRLTDFVNVKDEDDWMLLVGWLLAALRPVGPYPTLVLSGEQGSAKSTTARVLRRLVDPNVAPLRCEPREARDLAISANNAWLINLDNVSHLQPWLSDALCRLATGGGFSTRQLYEDETEKIFASQRPVVLNAIESVATRPDLIDRSLLIDLPTISEEARRAEAEFWAAFDAVHPALLGALFDVLSQALRQLPLVSLPTLPRMADFATWITAAESGLGWTAGHFLRAYTRSRGDANVLAVDASVIGPVLLECVAAACFTAAQWEGTAADLLEYLIAVAGDALPKSREWPKTPRALSGELRRLAPALRATGMEVLLPDAKRRQADRSRRRLIRLGPASVAAQPSTPSESSMPPSTTGADVNDSGAFASPDAVDGVDGRTDGVDEAGATPSTRNPATDLGSDDVDGVDGRAGDSAAADGEQWR
jgi:hypothetical protein